MTEARGHTTGVVLGALAALVLLAAVPAGAQSITGVAAVKNAGNSPDNFQDELFASFQRTTSVAVLSNNGIVARVRYAEVVGTDTGVFTSQGNTQATDYNINFNVTAPGAYDLNITTSLNGAFTLVDDGSASATADMTGVNGTSTGGTLASGTLGLTDPGSLSGNGGGNTGFVRNSTAQIQGTSNGSPVAHTLRFTWSASCSSGSGLTGGDECAVRLGLPITYGSQSAGNYPGAGGRVQANDGHFVTVALVSLCGDGVVQGARGEQCDLGGALNGTPGTCCSSSCQLRPNGFSCRAAAGVCDLAETCNGSSPNCPADAKSTAVCRASAGICDVAESCNGVSNTCPADGFASAATLCRASAGVCDLPDNCTGSGPTCPADAKRPNGFVCRGSAGACDTIETCNGSSNTCPSDVFLPPSTTCRAAAGVCDIAENCTGSGPACPADAVESSSTVCRGAAGICDEVENCDGSGVNCPADAFLGSTSGSFVCRPAAGSCDFQEVCDGSGINCPADIVAGAGTVCRGAAGVCDLTETCTGSGPACPADAKSTAVCRGSAGACDVAESCDGVSDNCPADAFSPASTVCRASAGVCDVAENCTGSAAACPADAFEPGSTVCRPSAGACDVAESCSGSGAACPADTKSTAVCRASAGACDIADSCDGVGDDCPADALEPATTVCRPAAGTCDVAETCTGSSTSCPADTGLPDTDSDTVCDAIDNCDVVANTSQDNNDSDPLGDACDPCTNIVPTVQDKAKITLTKLLAPAGDDKLSFKSFFTSMPSTPIIDPLTNGARFLIVDSTGAIPVDVTIPGGAYNIASKAGWKVNGSGTSWTYKNSGSVVPLVNGIQKVQIKAIGSTGKFKIGVKGKNGTYPINTANLPIVPTIVIDVPFAAGGQCGEAQFPAVPPAKPSCQAVSGGKTVKCK